MKIPNKRKFQQIAVNHSSDINCKDFITLLLQKRFYYKKCTAEPYSFLVNDAMLASDNPLQKIFLIYNKIMITNDQIIDEKTAI